MEKYFLLTRLAKCTLNIALKLTFSVFLFFFVFWLHFRPPRHCLMPFFERQFFTQMTSGWKTTFAAWPHQANLLSTCTPRSLFEVVHFIMLLPRRRAWIGPVNVDLRCIMHDHCRTFFWVWYHRISVAPFLEFSWNILLFSEFVSKSIVSSIQYIVVSSASIDSDQLSSFCRVVL